MSEVRKTGLVLASASPRRAKLLTSAGIYFEVQAADVDETPIPGESPEDLVQRLSVSKAEAVLKAYPGKVVLAADTVVEHDGEILGKPAGASQAMEMLQSLSGDTHEVMTGFTLCFPGGRTLTQVVITEVEFRELSADEMQTYVDSGEPLDKAGAYGIQAGAAGFVKEIRGSYTNVVGLPLAEVLEVLCNTGAPACDRSADAGRNSPEEQTSHEH